MILAGGLSTRLYPLTKQVPKPLVPVAGEPNAVHLIRYLKTYGFDEIAINVHYLADEIVRALGDGSAFGVRLEYLHESRLLGSAGAVKQLESFLRGGPFVVVGCDDLTDLPLDRLFAFHSERRAIATIGLVERDEVEHYGVVVTEPSGRIIGFQEKPPKGTEQSRLVNTGIYAFAPEIFEHIAAGEFVDFGKNVFPALQAANAAFFGYDARGAYWCDIGTPGEYRRASFDVVDGQFELAGARARGIDASATVAPDARIDANVWVGEGASIERAVRIAGPSVIGSGVRIEAGATIERSILWQDARVGAGADIRGSIVGMGYRVPAGATLRDAVVANEPVEV
jgi:NDP-sugar pyrophosphorylase family protein